MIRTLLVAILSIGISGCLINVKPGGGLGVVIRPTQAQISAAAVKIVCGSFGPIYFSGKLDSADTIRAIREHNAAWKAYGCKLASK